MTTLHIEFYSDFNDNLIKDFSVIVAKHNCGKSTTDLTSLQGYFKAYCSRWEYNGASIIDDGSLCLQMEGKPFLTISEHELIGQLTESESDLLMQEKLS